jgi:hypothetical protein
VPPWHLTAGCSLRFHLDRMTDSPPTESPVVPCPPVRGRRRTKLEKQIDALQSVEWMCSRAAMDRLQTETLRRVESATGYRLSQRARLVLQADAEAMVSVAFARANEVTAVRGKETVSVADWRVSMQLASPTYRPTFGSGLVASGVAAEALGRGRARDWAAEGGGGGV